MTTPGLQPKPINPWLFLFSFVSFPFLVPFYKRRQLLVITSSFFSGFENESRVLATSRRTTRPETSRNRARGKLKIGDIMLFKPDQECGLWSHCKKLVGKTLYKTNLDSRAFQDPCSSQTKLWYANTAIPDKAIENGIKRQNSLNFCLIVCLTIFLLQFDSWKATTNRSYEFFKNPKSANLSLLCCYKLPG